MTPDEKQFVTQLLDTNLQPMSSSPARHSTIVSLLRVARKFCGRDVETGHYNDSDKIDLDEKSLLDGTYYGFQFSGLLNYLIILDQIGHAFKLKNTLIRTPKDENNSIVWALTYFSPLYLNENKKHAIKTLRNTLAHKFGLATQKKVDKVALPRRQFILNSTDNPAIVELPKNDWDGEFTNKSSDTYTIIHLLNLFDLIEKIYGKLLNEIDADNIEIALEGGVEELKARYTII